MGSYHAVLGSTEYPKYIFGIFSSVSITFIFIVVVNSASTNFLRRTHAIKHSRKPAKLTYRGGTGPPKKWVKVHIYLSHHEIVKVGKSSVKWIRLVREGLKKKLVEFPTKRGGGFGLADFPLRKT